MDPVKAVCLDPWWSLILENLVVIIGKFKKKRKKVLRGAYLIVAANQVVRLWIYVALLRFTLL